MNAVVRYESAAMPMSAEQVRDHVNAIQKVMQAVMKKDVHYGIVPGAKKPSLYKPGAEVLCMTFHIDTDYEIADLSTADAYRYRVKCIGKHQQTGIRLGAGMGACSSGEDKYKWRKAICDEEFELAAENRRRIKFGKGSDGTYKVKQVRSEQDDIDNTVLKMACKRAKIAMVLDVTSASDIFTQDIEDLPDHLREVEEESPINSASLAKWVAKVAAAADSAAIQRVWKEAAAELQAAKDLATYNALKQVVTERVAAMKTPAMAEPGSEG